MRTTYRLEAVDRFIQKYIDHGGTIRTINEWSLWYWTTILECAKFRTAIIQEVFLSSWSSTHTVRQYKKTPAKYL